MTHLEVYAVGPLALLEDLGRAGHAAIGVPPSGAADRTALRVGNRLLGNAEGAAGIEVLWGGLTVGVSSPVEVAVTGAPCPVRIGDDAVGFGSVLTVHPGDRLHLGAPVAGLRTYVTVRGGLLAAPADRHFGSASSDPTSGLGPAPLRAGARMEVGEPQGAPRFDIEVPPVGPPGGELDVHAVLGPRDDRLTGASRDALSGAAWEVSQDADRVGIRLRGPRLEQRGDATLPSEPTLRGAIQVPPSGDPVVFLADHPTTGGYPVVAVVDDADTDRLAQLRPGERVRLHLRRSPQLAER